MPGFKIGTLTVGIVPADEGFEDDLRAQVAAAAEGVRAEVSLRLNQDAPISLNEDVHAAIDLATDGVKADVGLGLKDDAVEALDADVKAGIELVEADAKIKVSVDPKSAADAQEGMSSLIIGAVAAAAALTPGAILAAASIATVGLGALVVKSNADIQATYKDLATDVGQTLSTATAPLVPAVEASLVEVDSAVQTLKPTLKSLFLDAEPDLYQFTQGISTAAERFLPEFGQAVNSSRGIVTDFSNGLPALGAGVGNFFTGLTEDSQSTGRGLQQFEQLAGTALGTAGQVVGSFSAAASTALRAVVPAADGVLEVIDKLASPATVGALAGGLAVKQWGSGIQSGLQSVSTGFLNVAAKAEGAGGIVGTAGSAAEKAAGGFGTMADVMGGPWGIAIGAGVGLLGGLISSLDQSNVSASDFTAAIAQDSGEVGSNTEAVIQQTLAKQNLGDLNEQLGISTATLIASAAGDTDAQKQVTAAVTAQTSALDTSTQYVTIHGERVAEAGTASDQLSESLTSEKQRLDQVTGAVAAAIAQQNQQTVSLQAAEKATDIFTQQVNAEKLALQQATQTALINATALNQSLPVQGQLTSAAIAASLAYQQESGATTAYTNALTALYGQYGDTTQAQAAYTTSLVGLKGQISAGSNAVNANTAAGAKNLTAFQGVASAAETYSEKLYQQTGNANDANAALARAVTQIDASAKAAGLSAKQIQSLNEQLFGVKNASDIKINIDDSSVTAAIAAMKALEAAGLNAQQDEHTAIMQGVTHHAAGGPSYAGRPEIVGDGGQTEMFVPTTDGYVYPSVQQGQRAVAQHNAQVASAAPYAPAGMGGRAPVNINFYGTNRPTVEEMAQLKRSFAGAVGVSG